MFTDSYQVEEQNLATSKWITLKRFRLKYKWANVKCRFLCLFKWTCPEIMGSELLLAVIVKVTAYNFAREVARNRRQRSVRITRTDREGARLVKVVIWLNGKWCE